MVFKMTVLISGNGSNLQCLIDHCENGFWRAEINHVISNRKAAYGLIRAEKHGIKRSYLPYLSKRESRSEYEIQLLQLILESQPDLVVCAGWMHVLGVEFLENLTSAGVRIINLHPALPGEFPGTDGIGDAYWAYQKTGFVENSPDVGKTGCMVHEVIPEIDAGKVIQMFEVPIYPSDEEDDLRERVQIAEKPCLLMAVSKVILEFYADLHEKTKN